MRKDDARPDERILDVQGTQGGLSPFRTNYKCQKIERDWHWCPRCFNKTISRDLRKCAHCGGRVAFAGDDCKLFNERYDDWWMWATSIFGFQGWYHKSYWSI